MILSKEVKLSIDKSVLCWLATASLDHMPNVSPKEIFTYFDDETIIVANIASPQTVDNIRLNPNVCISFIDVLVQKGFQIKGQAKILTIEDKSYLKKHQNLKLMTGGKFTFQSIINIEVDFIKPIWAPSYQFYPDTKESEQIEIAKKAYGLR